MDYYAVQAVLSGAFDLVAALGITTLATAYVADTLHPKSKERVATWKKRKRARGETLWMPDLVATATPAPAIAAEPVAEPMAAVVPEPVVELEPEPVVEPEPEPVAEAPIEPEPEPIAEPEPEPEQELAIPTESKAQILEPALQPLPAALQQAELERVEIAQEKSAAATKAEQNLEDSPT